MLSMGVDIGSTSSKAVIMENGRNIIAKQVIPLGTGTKGPETVFAGVLAKAGIQRGEIGKIFVTGYGRLRFDQADKQLSEISCHAKGVSYMIPSARTVIDIGGQDAKALRLSEDGVLQNFVMNDKCAAGTGRFLDVMARVLDVRTEDLGKISQQATKEIAISNTCTVFAESEVISRLSANESVENIVAGIHRSVAKRVAGLAMRIGVKDTVVMSGGVALNQGVVTAMQNELNRAVVAPPDCQLAGAAGAALFAWEEMNK